MEFHKAYLENLISGEIDEDSRLEYKAADALKKEDGKKKEVTKDVSAFANAAGGVIVYGIAEQREGNSADHPTLKLSASCPTAHLPSAYAFITHSRKSREYARIPSCLSHPSTMCTIF